MVLLAVYLMAARDVVRMSHTEKRLLTKVYKTFVLTPHGYHYFVVDATSRSFAGCCLKYSPYVIPSCDVFVLKSITSVFKCLTCLNVIDQKSLAHIDCSYFSSR